MRRGAVVIVAVALLFGACGGKSKSSAGGTTTTTGHTTTSSVATTSVTEPTAYANAGDYVNGRHIGLIKAVNADHTVDVDVVQFLTGQAAIDAYRQDTGDTSGTPDDDYYVRNQNKLVRHLSLAADAVFRVQSLGQDGTTATSPDQGKSVTFADFIGFWSGSHHDQAVSTMFWITLTDGKVVTVEEQFVP
ncbi:MAG TPA: hypothetical protein VHD87_05410 [Acidimicrobiales bacterium]|nr:hypothetical protein [Acidimicrobiales bacterium]